MTDTERDLVTDLLVKWEEEFDAGNDVPASELCEECPHLEETVREKIETLKTIAWTKRDPARPLTDGETNRSKNLTGSTLGDRYRLEELVGSGGYGQVYRATDTKLRRTVAVKIGHHRTSSELLLDEARRVARLKHPGIVAVHDCGDHEGRVFLIFEFVEGKSLADVCREGRPTVRESVELIATVAESLSAAHKNGLVHRDLKPENILIDADGEPLITDFGVACTLEDVAKGRAGTCGTLAYMSPEVIAGETQLLDARCDVHSLGVVLFELLSGQAPFAAKDRNELREEILFRQPKRLCEIDSSIPPTLEAICTKAIAKHPSDRHDSVEEFAAELREWLATKEKTRKSWTWLAIIIALIAVIVSAVSWNHFGSDNVIRFDGQTRIVTDVERTLPVTLEAWIRPDPYQGQNDQWVIGSDVMGHYGLGIGITGSMLIAEYRSDVLRSSVSVPPNEWSHIAATFTTDETKLFLNGKLVATGPGSNLHGDTHFVIGNVGENNLLYYYHGDLRSARITNGVRYEAHFEPGDLEEDDATLFLLNAETAAD